MLNNFKKGLLPMLAVMLLVSWLLLREPDFGAFVVIAMTTFGILFLGGMNGLHFAALLVMLGVGFAGLVLSSPYRMQRIFGFMDPWADPYGSGYQLSHALIAFGRGEWFGVGLGASVEKLFYLPEAHTDFLLAVIAEELGFVGVVVVIGLFLWIGAARLRDRPPGGAARAALLGAGRAGHWHLARCPGAHQHGRQHGPAADQGPDAAADELRRHAACSPTSLRSRSCCASTGRTGSWRGGRSREPHHPDHGRRHRRARHPGARRGRRNARCGLGRGLARRQGRHGRAAGAGARLPHCLDPRACAARQGPALAQLLLPLNLLYAFWQSARALFRERPDVVLGMGGYIAFPGGMMASLLARPLALHEQNSIAGLANRVLARLADKVLAAFPDALRGAEWTGNPVRADIAAIAEPQARYAARSGPLNLLVVGGSLGAQALNEAVPRRSR